MQAQFELKRRRSDEGRLGWKVGFNGAGAREPLGLRAPAIGFITRATLIDAGKPIELAAGARNLLEVEIGLRMGAGVPADAPLDTARDAIESVMLAIEMVAVDLPMTDPEPILAGNIFHRSVLLSSHELAPGDLDLGGLTASVEVAGETVRELDPGQVAPHLGLAPRLIADVAAAHGDGLRAGDVIISGSVVAPLPVEPDTRALCRLGALGEMELSFRR
jgi:2-keto-4-pentenoate hydratase